MKLLSVTIPSYNSHEYMEKAIKSALVGGDDIEILVVDDGSSDNTLEIALKYEKAYPGIVRAIHKENGGHGSAVNTGLANATGLYFKFSTVMIGLIKQACSKSWIFCVRL